MYKPFAAIRKPTRDFEDQSHNQVFNILAFRLQDTASLFRLHFHTIITSLFFPYVSFFKKASLHLLRIGDMHLKSLK